VNKLNKFIQSQCAAGMIESHLINAKKWICHCLWRCCGGRNKVECFSLTAILDPSLQSLRKLITATGREDRINQWSVLGYHMESIVLLAEQGRE